MRKNLIPVLCAILMCFAFLQGCTSNNKKDEEDQQAIVDKNPVANKDTTTDKNEEKDEEEAIPYIIRLDAPVSIYKNATYDSKYVQCIYEDGSYTIIEEKSDSEGRKWGKLKSKVGWIDLTNVYEELSNPSLLRMGEVNGKINGEYTEVIVDPSGNGRNLIFIPREEITEFRFLSMVHDKEGLSVKESYCIIDKVSADNPAVISVSFQDTTTYGIVFSDAKGNRQNYIVQESGKNGEIILEIYKP